MSPFLERRNILNIFVLPPPPKAFCFLAASWGDAKVWGGGGGKFHWGDRFKKWLNFTNRNIHWKFSRNHGGGTSLFIFFWLDSPLKMFDWYLMTVGRSAVDSSCLEILCIRPSDLSGHFLWYFWLMNHFYSLFRYHNCRAQWRKNELFVLLANQISFICTLFWTFGNISVGVYNNRRGGEGGGVMFTPLEKASYVDTHCIPEYCFNVFENNWWILGFLNYTKSIRQINDVKNYYETKGNLKSFTTRVSMIHLLSVTVNANLSWNKIRILMLPILFRDTMSLFPR